MRLKTYLVTLLAAGLALGALGTVVADDNSSTSHGRGGRMDEMKARHAELWAARNASIEAFKENRSAAVDAFHAAHKATKASFLENKTRVQAECKAAREAAKEANESVEKQCVKDGLKPLIEKARAEHKAQREAFRDTVVEARKAAMQMFAKAREDIRAKHGGHASG